MTTLTSEQRRILGAAAKGHLYQNKHQRWVIYADPKRPERKARESLMDRGLIEYGWDREVWKLMATEKGQAAL